LPTRHPGRHRRASSSPSTPTRMTSVDDLWFLADEAAQQAEQTYHRLREAHEGVTEFETTKHVHRNRFRTVAERITGNGAPYGAHTLTYRPDGQLLLVRHEGVDMWVLPGGESEDAEDFRTAAERELAEEAGLQADFEGLELLGRVNFHSDGNSTWGILPVFAAEADPVEPDVRDPDDEISRADWFAELPPDTRDRHLLEEWVDERLR
jgi:8-oxo-dGTP diphosphatase